MTPALALFAWFALAALGVASCAGAPPPMPPVRTVRAGEDPSLGARIRSCEPLVYSDGADEALDCPAHVRAASGIVRVGPDLYIVQDDASFVAVRRASGRVDAITLPAIGGRRRFEARLGNKLHKLDLEAVVRLELEGQLRVVGIGSGSTPARESFAIVDPAADTARVFDASALYARLRDARAFSGSELNVEGAVVLAGSLRLFQRGNGAGEAVNATCDLELDALVRWIEGRGPVPAIERVVRYDLGRAGGVAYGFTDAMLLGERVLFAASAEDSPDTVEDGEVLGTRVGVIDPDGTTRWTALLDREGAPSRAKVEGIEGSDDPALLHAVVDLDDPDTPAELCTIELSGPW